jgi:serine/threonine-protein kinase
MGQVYAVMHKGLRRKFAAKVLHPNLASDDRIVDRMRLEAQALGRLEHENIVKIREFTQTQRGLPFIVMELLDGHSLREELDLRNRLPVTTALTHALDVANALVKVHSLGIVHRDIKPANLFLHAPEGHSIILKMLDFGVARVLPGVSASAPEPLLFPTRVGTVVGTPPFMSPEAAAGHPIDVRSDIYSAGCVLYRMLAGRGPFDHIEDTEKLLEALVEGDPAPPSAFLPRPLPTVVEALVLQAMSKDPNVRFQTASEFAEALYDITIPLIEAERSGELQVEAQPNTGVAITRRRQSSESPVQVAVPSPTVVERVATGTVERASTRAVTASAQTNQRKRQPTSTNEAPSVMSDTTWKILVFLSIFFGTVIVVVTASRWLLVR